MSVKKEGVGSSSAEERDGEEEIRYCEGCERSSPVCLGISQVHTALVTGAQYQREGIIFSNPP
jgi:hypothetical protein